jgi:hypothetical protein
MDDPEQEPPYRVEQQDRHFKLLDEQGNVIIVCADRGNADQYADLLNRSYQRGFKAGFRKARKGQT